MLQHPLIWYGVFPLAGYFIGSIPFGVLIARSRGVNLRQVGSGNVGATNVVRSVGRGWGYLCFLLDLLKGFVPSLTTGLLLGACAATPDAARQGAWLAVGAACVAGHVFPVWLTFRGGKGVATSLGVVLGMYPYFTAPGLIVFGLWIIITLVSRYVSLGSILSCLLFVPVFAVLHWNELRILWPMTIFACVIVLLILWRHRTNVKRLLAGTENQIGRKTK
ncbi:MAG: glycerol-3-phosphate 1-O-acyltransferase PlsY [Phycisphaerae bacterium]|nr:glycerol-3-phosphate 1-O-acyltransferase PlsY [Phycisphaerae bacterium]